jgi:hypoxanthine-guanine phosphoribosyltransferase
VSDTPVMRFRLIGMDEVVDACDRVAQAIDAAGARSGGRAKVEYPLNGDIAGLDVLLVDDVTDSGRTLKAALPYLREYELTLSPQQLERVIGFNKLNIDDNATRP